MIEYIISFLIVILILGVLSSLIISMGNDGVPYEKLCWYEKLAEIIARIIIILFLLVLVILAVCAVKWAIFG